jgi:hypothetical protein
MGRTTFSGPVRSKNGFEADVPATMVAGSGITAGVGTIDVVSVTQMGSVIETKILLDITGLNCGGTAADIIGVDGAANCHIGQITTDVNGSIFAGYMRCLEAPAGGNADIDLYAANVGTGVEDAAVTSLSGQAILVNSGALSLGTTAVLSAFPTNGQYLYLACGTATAATYTAGKLEIVLYGTV